MCASLKTSAIFTHSNVKAILKCPISGYFEMSQNYKNKILQWSSAPSGHG
jgi:hypothetical protein